MPTLHWYNINNLTNPLTHSQHEVDVLRSNYSNSSGLSLAESVLIFPEALRTDMSSYICIAVNGIKNLLNTPENGTAILYVQGKHKN